MWNVKMDTEMQLILDLVKGSAVGYWLQYIAVVVGVQALSLIIFKWLSWLFSKEESSLSRRPTLSCTSSAIAPPFHPSTVTSRSIGPKFVLRIAICAITNTEHFKYTYILYGPSNEAINFKTVSLTDGSELNATYYTALIDGLTVALDYDAEVVLVEINSKLLSKQMSDDYDPRDGKLIELKKMAMTLTRQFNKVKVKYVRDVRDVKGMAKWGESLSGCLASRSESMSGSSMQPDEAEITSNQQHLPPLSSLEPTTKQFVYDGQSKKIKCLNA